MAVRRLRKPMRTWRIGDPQGRFPIYSPEGAALTEGRWHRRGQLVIYTSEHFGTAMLEKLAHWNGILPPDQHFVRIEIPVGTSYEVVTKDTVPRWAERSATEARSFGASWLDDRRSAILIVPSVVSREEANVLINARHPEFSTIEPSLEHPVLWDKRLFS